MAPVLRTAPPKRPTKGEERRSRIIAEAAALLAAKGFRGTGLTELAERAGVTHPGLLYHFGTKERLLRAVVDERERLELRTLASSTDSDGWSLLHLPRIAEANADRATFTRLYVVLAAENLDAGDPLHDFFVDRYEVSRHVARLAVQGDIDAGRIRDDVDVDQLAREVVATLMGLEIQWLMDPARVDYRAAVADYTSGLLARLAP